MSTPWSALLPTAMVGTAREARALPAWPGEVGQVVADVAATAGSPALAVLRTAAVIATCDVAGASGAGWAAPLVTPAPPDALPPLPSGPLHSLVAWTLAEGPARVQHFVCRGLSTAGMRLPPALLPLALEQARRSTALRPLIAPVLGERGVWLARQRGDWQFAAGAQGDADAQVQWTDGNFVQRMQVLRRERAVAPAAAAERLASVIDEVPAKERADMVAVLADRLSLDDEPLLDRLRADRSREVKQAACSLLLRLPESAHTRRAASRLDALMRKERVLLSMRWHIDAPAAAEAGWKADNVDAARPRNESLGERAWWLCQLVRQVPLGWWTAHTGMDADALLKWAHGTDWTEALVRGWRDVLFAASDDAWCEALLAQWPAKFLRDSPAAVMALLPMAAREPHWQRTLSSSSAMLHAVVADVLAACPAGETLSAPLSITLADAACRKADSRLLGDDYALRAMLPDLCGVLHDEALPRIAQLPRHSEETPAYATIIDDMTRVIAVRRAFQSLTTQSPS